MLPRFPVPKTLLTLRYYQLRPDFLLFLEKLVELWLRGDKGRTVGQVKCWVIDGVEKDVTVVTV